MRKVEINHTAFKEENLTLITSLTDEQIIKAIEPIILEERNGGEEYDNSTLLDKLINVYGEDKVRMGFNNDIIHI